MLGLSKGPPGARSVLLQGQPPCARACARRGLRRPEDTGRPSPDGNRPRLALLASDLGRLPVLGASLGMRQDSGYCLGHVSPAHDCSLVSAENLRIH